MQKTSLNVNFEKKKFCSSDPHSDPFPILSYPLFPTPCESWNLMSPYDLPRLPILVLFLIPALLEMPQAPK